jgi:hypothetical protein
MGNSSSSSPKEKSSQSSWFPSFSNPPSAPASSFLPTTPAPAPAPAPAPSFFGTPTTAPAPAPAPESSIFPSFGNPKTGGRTRRKKRSTKKNKTKGRINFSKIKWGSFTKIYNNYIKNHPNMMNQLPDLKHFAHYVNKHPTQFTKKTHKKALFTLIL